MAATYTFDIFSSLDGFGSATGNWGGYWGKQGPELLARRLEHYSPPCRMVFGANTYRLFAQFWAEAEKYTDVDDPWGEAMHKQPATVISNSLVGPLDWPDAAIERGDALAVVPRLKAESLVPLRSHGSLSMNRSLLAAGLVDYIQVTIFPVLTGLTGQSPIFEGAEDFDLELVESRLLDGRTQELIYRPSLHH
ncbi:deaminase [Arthrobacter sp. MYb211]|uniref:dihydrofolate reductase family protein n=1 Tax=Micrococcaceae TaxID=1268 RepID=UPI000BB77547|nr:MULTISPECIES: dihydrofolate reductase family protein [Micrococcaceae]PCC30535.1 deaminase [Glutamicibacter sp. BW80]PQZ97632.1 deaminase [Arthrobacter sp. MYb224]PRA04137.1 deaminase [Arthrobacter sp. MYb229]PRA11645.1 deaminase [Arthrobacter sp. MYb221]PRB51951.1 deaminase [Arthrobacter sp. MYb216]